MDLRHPKINFSPHHKIGDLISGSVSMKRKSGQSIRRLLLIYNQLDLDDTTEIWASTPILIKLEANSPKKDSKTSSLKSRNGKP